MRSVVDRNVDMRRIPVLRTTKAQPLIDRFDLFIDCVILYSLIDCFCLDVIVLCFYCTAPAHTCVCLLSCSHILL
jgi:hypothetical protein